MVWIILAILLMCMENFLCGNWDSYDIMGVIFLKIPIGAIYGLLIYVLVSVFANIIVLASGKMIFKETIIETKHLYSIQDNSNANKEIYLLKNSNQYQYRFIIDEEYEKVMMTSSIENSHITETIYSPCVEIRRTQNKKWVKYCLWFVLPNEEYHFYIPQDSISNYNSNTTINNITTNNKRIIVPVIPSASFVH